MFEWEIWLHWILITVASIFDFFITSQTVAFIALSQKLFVPNTAKIILALILIIIDLFCALKHSGRMIITTNIILINQAAEIKKNRRTGAILLWLFYTVKILFFIFFLMNLGIFSFTQLIYVLLLTGVYLIFHFFGSGTYIFLIPFIVISNKWKESKLYKHNDKLHSCYDRIQQIAEISKMTPTEIENENKNNNIPENRDKAMFDTHNCERKP